MTERQKIVMNSKYFLLSRQKEDNGYPLLAATKTWVQIDHNRSSYFQKLLLSAFVYYHSLCLLESRVSEYNVVHTSTAATVLQWGRSHVKFWYSSLASNRQTTASPKYNDDISLMIWQDIIYELHPSSFHVMSPLKGIVQRILRVVETRLIRSVLVNWRTLRFYFWILKWHHHKRSIKLFSYAKRLMLWLVWSNWPSSIFASPSVAHGPAPCEDPPCGLHMWCVYTYSYM